MIIYLAGFKTIKSIYNKPTEDKYILSSFWDYKTGNADAYMLQQNHILDSGAFSAINDKSGKYKNYDWDLYVKNYINFINKTKQKLFFEIDIDIVVGLSKVEYYRKQIEDGTGIAPIVCWHQNRGKEYWIKSCENYKYVAIGTTTASAFGKKIRKNPIILEWFIRQAKQNNTKIHGLGFTSIPWLKKLKFDSVDSTTWLSGGKYGEMSIFKNNNIYKTRNKINNNKIDSKKLNLHNFEEWVKFQKYAKNNL